MEVKLKIIAQTIISSLIISVTLLLAIFFLSEGNWEEKIESLIDIIKPRHQNLNIGCYLDYLYKNTH